MLEKLKSLETRFNELTELVADSAVIADQPTWQKYVKARSDLEDVVAVYLEYKACLQNIEEAQAILYDKASDTELSEMAELELDEQLEKKEMLEQKLKILLLPKDPNDQKNVILEIRAGTGGDEAGLFAADLYKMYMRYAERYNWRTE
ncbi:MAG: PCRF domain-containing protein, partial [Clostridia bacterium]|nr:PCRF domain-containing protein [Clostridia bacterium]